MNGKGELAQDTFVYQEIFEAILAQRLLPGTKLTEDNLAKIFKVSRTVVRRALLRLSHDGIVEIRPNKGASVSRPSIKQAREILDARRLIECAIVRQVTGATNNKDEIDTLRQLVCAERDRFSDDNRSSGIRLSGDFHLELARLSGNSTLIDILTRLVPQTSLIIAQYEKPGHENCSHDQHFELIDAIASGDQESASKLMDQHLRGIENKLPLADEKPPADLQDIFAHISSNNKK